MSSFFYLSNLMAGDLAATISTRVKIEPSVESS